MHVVLPACLRKSAHVVWCYEDYPGALSGAIGLEPTCMQVIVLGDSPCCVCNSVARLICPPPATNAGPRRECTMSWSRLGHTCGMHTCILTYIHNMNTIQARQQTIKQTDKQTRKHTDIQTYIYIYVYITAYMRTSIHAHTLSGRRHVHHGHSCPHDRLGHSVSGG